MSDEEATRVAVIMSVIVVLSLVAIAFTWAVMVMTATYGPCPDGQVRIVEETFRGCVPWQTLPVERGN